MVGVLVILILLNIPIFIKIAHWFYPSQGELRRAFRYLVVPDIVSLFKGEYWKDRLSELKLAWVFGLCVFIVFIEYAIVTIIVFN